VERLLHERPPPAVTGHIAGSTRVSQERSAAQEVPANGLGLMSGFKDRGFGERLSAASSARRAMTAKFLQRPGLDDPAVSEKRAARVAVSVARDVRRGEREERRLAEQLRIEAERAAHAAAAAAQKVADDERAAAERAVSDAAREIEQKAARDARYAARKARKS
jgi:hypothetical protein